MRHLLVLAVVAVWLVPGAAVAQEATPQAATVERTNIRYFLPYTPDGLAAGLTVSGEVSGACFSESLAAVGRPDAWVCSALESGDRYDPCFENPFGPINEPSELACVDSPFATDVVRFTLTEPLQREKDIAAAPPAVIQEGAPPPAPAGAMGETAYPAPMTPAEPAGIPGLPAPSESLPMPAAPVEPPLMPAAPGDAPAMADQPADVADVALDPLEIPWALELANGERCTLLTGATAVLAGQRLNYGCEGGGYVLGEVDQRRQVWTVSYLAADAFASELVPVSVVWV